MNRDKEDDARLEERTSFLIGRVNKDKMARGSSYIDSFHELGYEIKKELNNAFEAGYGKKSSEVLDDFEFFEKEIKELRRQNNAFNYQIFELKDENKKLQKEKNKLVEMSKPTQEVKNFLNSAKDAVICMLLGEMDEHAGLIERFKEWHGTGEAIFKDEIYTYDEISVESDELKEKYQEVLEDGKSPWYGTLGETGQSRQAVLKDLGDDLDY